MLKNKVVKKYSNFEVREYDSSLVAEALVSGDKRQASNDGFRLIARYIFGHNNSKGNSRDAAEKGESVAMTAPVEIQRLPSEKVAMTAPVEIQESSNNKAASYLVRFTMPSKYTLENLPVPRDSRVKIRLRESAVYAARKYSGFWSDSSDRKQKRLLIEGLQKHGYTYKNSFVFARYNSPWTPWFLRHNEVLVELEGNQKGK